MSWGWIVFGLVAWFVVATVLAVAIGNRITRPDTVVRFTDDRHAWTGWKELDEPGISDVHGGIYTRCEIRCSRCGETRQVWRDVPPQQLAVSSHGCPGVPR